MATQLMSKITSCGSLIETSPRLSCRKGLRRHDCCQRAGAMEVDASAVVESQRLAAQHDALILGYTGLVKHIANHLFRRRNYVDVNDLIRAGMAALSEALRRYENDRAGSFEAYASVRIREAMLDFVRKSDWSLRAADKGRETSKTESLAGEGNPKWIRNALGG